MTLDTCQGWVLPWVPDMDTPTYRDPVSPGTHPNSLEAMSAKDPALRRKLREGRRAANRDVQAMKAWESQGFLSAMQPEKDSTAEGDLLDHIDDVKDALE